jgi:ribosomal protein S27AE
VSLFERIRFKGLAIVLAVLVAGIALAAFTTWPAWPIFGASIAVFAVAVNTVGSRLAQNVCMHCGESLSVAKVGEHGVACSKCGSLSFPGEPGIARQTLAEEPSDEDAESESKSA